MEAEETTETKLMVQVPFEDWSRSQAILHQFRELVNNNLKMIEGHFQGRVNALSEEVERLRRYLEAERNASRGFEKWLPEQILTKAKELAGDTNGQDYFQHLEFGPNDYLKMSDLENLINELTA